MSTIELGQADNGKLIELHREQKLAIRLPENPTTGYLWNIVSYNKEIIALESSVFSSAPSSGVGGSGERTFVFKATNIGTTQLQMKHWQSWEGDQSVDKHYHLTIRVYD
jgi:inhibitor of cysteine peptidase